MFVVVHENYKNNDCLVLDTEDRVIQKLSADEYIHYSSICKIQKYDLPNDIRHSSYFTDTDNKPIYSVKFAKGRKKYGLFLGDLLLYTGSIPTDVDGWELESPELNLETVSSNAFGLLVLVHKNFKMYCDSVIFDFSCTDAIFVGWNKSSNGDAILGEGKLIAYSTPRFFSWDGEPCAEDEDNEGIDDCSSLSSLSLDDLYTYLGANADVVDRKLYGRPRYDYIAHIARDGVLFIGGSTYNSIPKTPIEII